MPTTARSASCARWSAIWRSCLPRRTSRTSEHRWSLAVRLRSWSGNTPGPRGSARPCAGRARRALAAWSRSSCTSAMTSRRLCTTRSPTAPTPSAWRAAMAPRRSLPRSPPNGDFRMCACRPGRATISRSISASAVTTSWERSTRSPTGASGWWTSPRSTAACSSTTSRSGSTPKRSSRRVSRRQAANDRGDDADRARPRWRHARFALHWR